MITSIGIGLVARLITGIIIGGVIFEFYLKPQLDKGKMLWLLK